MRFVVEEPELPFPPVDDAAVDMPVAAPDARSSCHPFATFGECPMCGATMAPEHAHFRCTGCGWRDSCCD